MAAATTVRPAVPTTDRLHSVAVAALAIVAGVAVVALAFHGWDYYRLPLHERAWHPLHPKLRPSGTIGIRLGMAGLACFAGIYLYAARKRVKAMNRLGKTRKWLDFHIVLGIAAPAFITLHSSLKFNGLAGIAYWIMIAVMLSGIVGRYLYAQIPRSLSAAEMSLEELRELVAELTRRIEQQQLISRQELEPMLRVATPEEAAALPLGSVLLTILRADLLRPFEAARLRWRFLTPAERFFSFGGLRRSGREQVEAVIDAARRRSSLASKISFLARAQQIFHLWHVVHRPFSYSFAILVTVHIVVALLMGYF